MATINKNLVNLTIEEIERISIEYLLGRHDLSKYGFRIKGFNGIRKKHGLPALDKDLSCDYRLLYIREHYTHEMIYDELKKCMLTLRVDKERWKGIEVLGCRFGREYARLFKQLLGSSEYRKLSEECRVAKLVETQTVLYGGVGLAGTATNEKAKSTNTALYGVSNPMNSSVVREKLAITNETRFGGMSPFSSQQVRDKARKSKVRNIVAAMENFKQTGVMDTHCVSGWELIVFTELVNKFGRDDVYYQYGIHPSDKRYPYNCDFYIKSLDLFIELNFHYSHGKHWYDENSQDDKLRVKHLSTSDSKRSRNSLRVWTITDVEKRKKAMASNLNYLVFWDSSQHQINKKRIPNLKDFYEWLIDYDCDYEQFIKDHPNNTY